MLPLAELPLYLTALIAVYLLPGPDMALLLSTTASRGSRAGLSLAGGLACARFLHALLSGLGLAALLATQPLLYDAIRWVGAAYLLWLALRLLLGGDAQQAEQDASARSLFLRGLLSNLLNPKALMFCALFLPQFASAARGPLLPQFVLLGAILVVVGIAFDTFYVVAASQLTRRLRRRAQGGRFQRWLLGSVFLALAGRLLVG